MTLLGIVHGVAWSVNVRGGVELLTEGLGGGGEVLIQSQYHVLELRQEKK